MPSAVALPEVVAAVDGRVPVLADGGIRSGTDALVALALGAAAILVGRPVLWALAAGGADAVAALLSGLADDLGHVMAMAEGAGPGDLGDDLVIPWGPLACDGKPGWRGGIGACSANI